MKKYLVVNKKTKAIDSVIRSAGNLVSSEHYFIECDEKTDDVALLNSYITADNLIMTKPKKQEFDDEFDGLTGQWKRSEAFKLRLQKTPEILAEEKVLMVTNPLNFIEICDVDNWVNTNIKNNSDVVEVLKNIIVLLRSTPANNFPQ